MLKTSVTKLFTFEAAHQLPDHNGKCARLHGHSYKLEVTVSGPLQNIGSSDGMVIDFADLSKIVNEQIIDQWDHRFLNDILPFRTTAENLAVETFKRLTQADLTVNRIKLWETSKAYVEVTK
ncbi:MAG: 6-pyruvoyl tetrahydrobiopterin synthase [Candidatus Berkelbacteria bacterium Gr01-1014_85]|uniref:6-carboxy-5,6,7,8-tetrahydropterin synthase n=1 Tax=Candidatus Berkelbacteria bacterium Gr01-1014_85 TaxID=2017150 RepID=A0A554JAU4_9BACT|nr:MAG: 6-pyruvoyl tetrahydrobiopterin synthase [Candidatus Berkelbacteria bacterium Gr01-1014_85]